MSFDGAHYAPRRLRALSTGRGRLAASAHFIREAPLADRARAVSMSFLYVM